MKALLIALSALAATSTGVRADTAPSAPAVIRTVLEKHDLAGVDNKEVDMVSVEFPIGSSAPSHTHPGDESAYVLKGSIVLKSQGKPDRTIMAGQSFFNVRGVIHSAAAGPQGATVLSTYIVDKGVPISSQAP